jgi:hypothetical protein
MGNIERDVLKCLKKARLREPNLLGFGGTDIADRGMLVLCVILGCYTEEDHTLGYSHGLQHSA